MRILTLLLIGALQMSGLVAQVTEETTGSRLPAGFETRTLTIPGGRDLKYMVAEPKGFTSDQVVDVWIVMPTSTSPKKSEALDIAAATVSDYLAKQGKIAVMWPQAELGADRSAQGALLRSLHLKYRIRSSRLTVQAAKANAAHAVTLLRAFPYDIGRMALYEPQFGDAVKSLILPSFSRHHVATVSLSPHDRDLKQLETKIRAAGGIAKYELPPRNEPAIAPISFPAVRALDSARDALENLESATVRDAARALTSFHDAAAKGDEDRYFDLFPEDAVFLGTDGSERWEQPAFKKFALPYFQKESAWIYIPLVQRFSVVEEGKVLAFDELLGHRKLGLCRGSGVLAKRKGAWKILQYNLSVPIPNGIMGDVAKTIRRSELGPAAGATTTTIFLVRHAEKITEPKSRDPLLTELGEKRAANLAKLLKHEKLGAAYASEYRRTQLTVKPAADRFGIPVTVFTARDPRGLAKKIKDDHAGQNVLIAGHSNTVPAIARALGIAKPPRLDESDYGDVFVIRLTPAGASMLRLAVTTEP